MANGYGGGTFVAFTDDYDDDSDENLARVVSQIDRDFLNEDESLALSLQWEEINSNQSAPKSKNEDEEEKSTTFIIENWDSLADQDGFEVTVSPGKPKYDESKSSSLALSDPQWEMIDPTPNIHTLFIEFDRRFFWGELAAVEVGWSKRMTTCAGICYYSGRRSGYCRIGLSEPLLKLRARKELVETLLHEMIHAYLFVTNNNKDHDGHGGEFHKHMYRINKETGLAISVYHTFHDEVAHYKRHWWRCDGPCRNRPPYYGYVKRASNRAPSKNDFWWADHQRICGGNYVKVKEPEEYTEKQLKKKNKQTASASSSSTKTVGKPKQSKGANGKDIRGFLTGSGGLSSASSSQSQPTLSQTGKPVSQKPPLPDKSNSSKNSQSTSQSISSPPPFSFVPTQKSPPSSSLSQQKTEGADTVLNSGSFLRKIVGENRRLPVVTKEEKLLAVVDSSDDESSNSPVVITGETSVVCPVCGIHVSEACINIHLDSCLSC